MLKKFLKTFLPVLLLSTAISALAQVEPSVGKPGNGWPMSVGIAYSNYDTDWSGRLSGASIWADWNFYKLPPLWDGFGVEIEGRDLNTGRTGIDPKLRMDTLEGGVIYTTHFYRRFHPYMKFLVGDGSIDFSTFPNFPNYSHDTRIMYVPGVGADTRFYKSLWLRVNYEYQIWPDFFRHHAMNPSGVDFGVAYEFSHFR